MSNRHILKYEEFISLGQALFRALPTDGIKHVQCADQNGLEFCAVAEIHTDLRKRLQDPKLFDHELEAPQFATQLRSLNVTFVEPT